MVLHVSQDSYAKLSDVNARAMSYIQINTTERRFKSSYGPLRCKEKQKELDTEATVKG